MPGRYDNDILPAVMMTAGLDAGLMHAPNPGCEATGAPPNNQALPPDEDGEGQPAQEPQALTRDET